MSEASVVEKHFELSDSNRDGQLDSREWLGYMREEDHHLKRDKATRSLRYILDQDYLPPHNVRKSLKKSHFCIIIAKTQGWFSNTVFASGSYLKAAMVSWMED